MSKTLYLMRHGQTMFNLRGKVQGASDSPLTSLGISQAKQNLVNILTNIIFHLEIYIHLALNAHVIHWNASHQTKTITV